jgi:hypothetical protein
VVSNLVDKASQSENEFKLLRTHRNGQPNYYWAWRLSTQAKVIILRKQNGHSRSYRAQSSLRKLSMLIRKALLLPMLYANYFCAKETTNECVRPIEFSKLDVHTFFIGPETCRTNNTICGHTDSPHRRLSACGTSVTCRGISHFCNEVLLCGNRRPAKTYSRRYWTSSNANAKWCVSTLLKQ